MNDIDVKNIKKFIAKIEAQNFKFEDGGQCTYEYLDSLSLSDLKAMLSDYKNRKKHIFVQGFKKKVDEIFEKFAEEGENVIVLTCCNADESGRSVVTFEDENPMELIDFEGFAHKYNKQWHPVGESFFYEDDTTDKKKELTEKSYELLNDLLNSKQIEPIEEYYNEDDGVNFVWFGVYGVNKDYEVVTFVIRDDGMLSDYDAKHIIKTF